MSEAKATTDHETVQAWAEYRGGRPATVRHTGRAGEDGLLRLDFEDADQDLEPISWETFFEKFDQEDLVFLSQKARLMFGHRFHKLIDRKTADAGATE